MRAGRVRYPRGISITEIMVASVVVVITALGALSYQYFGARQVRIAQTELAAARVGQLILEDWKSTGGEDLLSYDATELGLGFETPTEAGSWDYAITVDGVRLYIWMSQSDVAQDDFAGVTLRQISVTVKWRRDLSHGEVGADDPSLFLTTYVRLGQD
jgi:Tfp pilus assembly protein PilV